VVACGTLNEQLYPSAPLLAPRSAVAALHSQRLNPLPARLAVVAIQEHKFAILQSHVSDCAQTLTIAQSGQTDDTKQGDVITHVNNVSLQSPVQLRELIGKRGKTVARGGLRSGARSSTRRRAGDRPGSRASA
jgi:hypothetical protein